MRNGLMALGMLVGFTACASGGSESGSASSSTGSGGGGSSSSSSGGASSSSGGNGLITLVEGSWSLEAGTERYECVRYTVPTAMDISEFHPLAPVGTHHAVLTLATGGLADGQAPCNDGDGGAHMI